MLRYLIHLSVQGHDSFSANISGSGFFRRNNKILHWGGGGGLPKEETMIRSAKVITGATNLVAILRLLNFSH